ncbi:pyridoxamine 5'-phosphate oxidase family protein [Methanococcoides burtonii]|uniref:Pyridoxamine 5'-phosphate oxidase family protein n=1 Tax=Methanococcoides burtonii (strain DSM 6242 / NBRC 107633 / OCM 468 / ACE-M) TaxID=259564 RepID=Q12VD9_METBU|nr:pyridoxamine 5'-phosphate oxidase family protein [Methanococcoides burtonii]ABE52587.1 Pyridoxamine 5'-phosphate oxidase family protein [Methanococcoides burtonii DSM 6242]
MACDPEIKERISEYLKKHPFLNLATISPEGNPMVHSMGFASSGPIVYFGTGNTTRKFRNIEQNPNVAFTVDEDGPDVMNITGIQMEGKASFVTDEAELGQIFQLMVEKFPFMAELPNNPDNVMIKVEPTKAFFLDYAVEFGFRYEVDY